MVDSNIDQRLGRIEDKMDKLADALVTIARFEEKMEAYNKYREDSWERMNKFSSKLDVIEKMCDENAHTVNVINKLFWIAIAVGASAIAAQIWM
jgi:succinate dehydrogenase/fumarate reductase flavoprotein subunit